MASTTTQEQKRKEIDVREFINSLLAQAASTRKGFSPDLLKEFEETGRQARESRQEELVVRPSRVSPIPQRTGEVAATKPAIEAALNLAESLERGNINLRRWVEGRG